VAYFSADIQFLNATIGSKVQPFDALFHGLLQRTSGTRRGIANANMWFRVRDSDHRDRRPDRGAGLVRGRLRQHRQPVHPAGGRGDVGTEPSGPADAVDRADTLRSG
jgi:hypothetical protein